MSKIPYLETMYRGSEFSADYFAWGCGRKSAEDTEHDSYIMPIETNFCRGDREEDAKCWFLATKR